MRTKLKLVVTLALATLLAPAISRAQQDEWTSEPDDTAASKEPAVAEPKETPPPPPAKIPAPPQQQQQQAAAPDGQWVYTSQYGWVWMPYDSSYTYVPPDGGGGYPYMYVYYPVYGWCWVGAPWVWGYGPWPYFGVYGAVGFAWYNYYAPYYHYGHGHGYTYPTRPYPGHPVPGRTYPSRPYPTRPYATRAPLPGGAPAYRGPVAVPGFRGGGVMRPVPGGVGVGAPRGGFAPRGGGAVGRGGGGHR